MFLSPFLKFLKSNIFFFKNIRTIMLFLYQNIVFKLLINIYKYKKSEHMSFSTLPP